MLAQLMEMRTDVRRTALWQAPVHGGSASAGYSWIATASDRTGIDSLISISNQKTEYGFGVSHLGCPFYNGSQLTVLLFKSINVRAKSEDPVSGISRRLLQDVRLHEALNEVIGRNIIEIKKSLDFADC